MPRKPDRLDALVGRVMRHTAGVGIAPEVLASKIKIASLILQTQWERLPYAMQRDLYYIIEATTYQMEGQGTLGSYMNELVAFKKPIGSVEISGEGNANALMEDLMSYERSFPPYGSLDAMIEMEARIIESELKKKSAGVFTPEHFTSGETFSRFRQGVESSIRSYQQRAAEWVNPATYVFEKLRARAEKQGNAYDPHFCLVNNTPQFWDLCFAGRMDSHGAPAMKTRYKDIAARVDFDTHVREMEQAIVLFDGMQRGEANQTEANTLLMNRVLSGYYAELHVLGLANRLPQTLRDMVETRGLSLMETLRDRFRDRGTPSEKRGGTPANLPTFSDFVYEIWRLEADAREGSPLRKLIKDSMAQPSDAPKADAPAPSRTVKTGRKGRGRRKDAEA